MGWRADWSRDFPFLFVQIAPFRYGDHDRAARLREQQQRALGIPRTGMVVTGDITSDPGDIHPKNKQDVGLRLANLALAGTYRQAGVVARSPTYREPRRSKGPASGSLLQGRERAHPQGQGSPCPLRRGR